MKIIKHSEIDKKTLLEIVEIKNLSWGYSIEQHMAWLEQNIENNDVHFLKYDENSLIGYLNLVEVSVNNGSKKIPFLGIGNVCTKYKGKGDGLRLMLDINCFLKENGFRGLLFCREYLVDFYRKAGWRLIKNIHPKDEVFTLDYNSSLDALNFATYNGRLF